MLREAFGRIQNLDESVRRGFAERAFQGRNQQVQDYVNDLQGRMGTTNPDRYESVGKSIASRMGEQDGFDESSVISRLRAGENLEQLYRQAGAAAGPGMGVRLNDMLSGSSLGARAGQAGVYGAIGGGITLGLTAAGQGLFALTDYLSQGQETEAKRNQELPS